VATYLLNEKRAEIFALEARLKVNVLLIPNPHLETPNYTVERLRHDSPELDAQVPSYEMVNVPAEEATTPQGRAQENKPARPEPLVKGITPDQPAPVTPTSVARAPLPAATPEPAAKPSIVDRLFGWLKGPGTPATAAPIVTPPATAAKPPREPRRGEGQRGRDGQERKEGGRRDGRRGGQDRKEGGRPPAEGAGPREERKPREPREARPPREAREPREGRGGEDRRPGPPRDRPQGQPRPPGNAAPAPAADLEQEGDIAAPVADLVEGTSLNAAEGDGRRRRRRGGRGGERNGARGERAERVERDEMRDATQAAEEQPAAQGVMEFAPPAAQAAEREPRETREPREPREPRPPREPREPREPRPPRDATAEIPAAPAFTAPAETHTAPATVSASPVVEAPPVERPVPLAPPVMASFHELSQHEDASPSRPVRRRRETAAAEPAAEPLVLVQTQPGVAIAPVVAEDELPRRTKPRRRRSQAVESEPLMLVETQPGDAVTPPADTAQ
jgi:ribonuclease E